MDDSCDRLLKVKKSSNIAPGVVDLSVVEDENYIKGGILSSNKLSWVSCGPRITNLNNNDGSKKTGWTFGWAAGDKTTRVVCVEELTTSSAGCPILVVGCESEHGGTLCFYHSGCSRVLKAINFPNKITSVAVVSKSNESHEKFSNILEAWHGMVAVGTSIGKVYLVDICWKSLERCIEDYRLKLYDEKRQSKLVEVTVKDVQSDYDLKISSNRSGKSTLALWLNEVTYERAKVAAHPGLHNILGRMPLEFLAVSTVKYFPQISTLAVGYNTSCFQLWDLQTLSLLYTSALLEAMLPVFSFSLLEPSDDPRFVCYLWSMHHSIDEDNIPFAGMYIISYQDKYLKPFSNQYFYEFFSSCSIRYQLDLGADMSDIDIASGRIISCQSIHRSTAKSSPLWTQTESEGGEEGTASLLSIAWEVWTPNQLSVYRKLTLFDLNQWYREYMPTSSDMEYSQFMAHFCLPDGQLLDVKVIPSSVKQFQALQPLDEHFYPTATSFDCLALHQSQLMVCSHVGVQQEALETLTEAGPSGLLLPACLYKQCTQAGLRPLLVDIGSPTTLHSSDQRAYLLSVALEQELTQYLRQCVAHWADGSHAVAGCTLPALLGWAWDRVQRYKKWLDRLCVPLFDYSGTALDTNDMGIFHHMICQFHRLRDLFHLVLDKYSNCIITGNFEQQFTVINLVAAFYDSIFWCVRNNVLPEVNASESKINGCIPYFTDKIINSTISRRAELHQLAKSLHDPSPVGLLLIDAVIAQEAGTRVTDQWEREGAMVTLGKYPPASVQSLLRTYLIRNVPPGVKHFIVTYFLLDVAHAVCSLGASETVKQTMLKYPTDFGLTESQSKIVEAFWCLDHKQFQSGVDLLLDSCVYKEDLQVYQHRTVLCLLAAVGEHKLALHYLTSRRRTPTEPQDIRMEMTLLLNNDLIHEAFQFQRHHQSMSTELLEQFFKGCVKMNKLDVIFKLALTSSEEEAFMAFLDKTCHPQADDLRVLYLLSRSRYVEAIDVNEKLHSALSVRRGMGLSPAPGARKTFGPRGGIGGGAGSLPTKTLTTRDLIINSVSKSLPSITRELADYCHREKHFSWKQINRPKPLSVVVHTELSKDRLPYYKTSDSQLIQAAVSKTREIWAPLLATPAALKRKLQTSVEDTPFLRNPIHSRLNSSVTNIEEVHSGIRGRTDDDELQTSKRARLEFTPTEKESSQTKISLDKTSDMDITCPLSSAVLHTPLIARIVKKTPRETHTPQSILKGKSGPNTPQTPARDRLGSPAVGRQIRFSLPGEKSPSPSKSEEELHSDEKEYFKMLSPRKSIHETSDLYSRLPTPSNPRVSQKPPSRSLRSSISKLQFDESEIPQNEHQPELSSTAVTLLKKMSSSPPTSSEEDYYSFQSSSSGVESSKIGNKLELKISYGLEGNIESRKEETVEDNIQEQTYSEDYEGEDEDIDVSLKSNESQSEVESNDMETTITPSQSRLAERNSVVLQDQANESMHLTLEYKGDTSSSLYHSGYLPQSSSRSITLEFANNQSSLRESVECEVMKPIEQEITLDSRMEKVEVDEEEAVLSCTLSLAKERESAGQGIDFSAIEENVAEAIKESSAEPMKSDELEVAMKTKTGKVHENFSQESSLSLIREGTGQDIDLGRPIIEDKLDATLLTLINTKSIDQVTVGDKTIQDFDLPSQQKLECNEQEKGSSNLDNKGQEPTSQDTSRSARASTPLPLILEELVKKGRISLSVPECESRIDPSITSEQLPSTEADKDAFTCSLSEEPVSVEDTMNEEGSASTSQKEIKDSKSSSGFENYAVSKKEAPILVPTKGALKQMFVFGNQASLSTSVVNSNLTFTIGTNVFGSSTWEESSKVEDTETKNKEEIFDEPLICSTSDEPNNTISQAVEKVNEYEPSNVKLCEDIQNANASKISQDYSLDLPEDDQVGVLDFYVDTATSTTKQLEADSTADFELKMSEGDSVMEVSCCGNNDVATTEVAEDFEEPVFQTLKPVEYQVDERGAVEEDISYDQLGAKGNVDDEDIYGDLEEAGNEVEETEENNSGDEECCNEENEDEEEEVICLGSSSDDEPPTKIVKSSSTPYSEKLIPKVAKKSQFQNETLDYEVENKVDEDDQEGEDYEEDYDDQEQEIESSYCESSLDDENVDSENEDDSKVEKKNLYFSSESESDTSHHRRSWKEQRQQYDSNESLMKENITSEEDTVESPPFELIGHNSQESQKEKFKSVIEDDSPKVEASTAEESTKVIKDAQLECDLDPNQSATKESTRFEVEIRKVETDVDIVKLAEENRQKRLETGSIHELKKRRSKRYSSATELNESKKLKLRRRSCSLHDFMSAFIKETKSTSNLSPEKELNTNSLSIVNASQISSLSHNATKDDNSPVKATPALTTQQSFSSEIEFSETASVTSSLLPEVGSVISNQTSACDFPISTVPRPLENLKRKGKSFVNRLSSLHDISEENADNSDIICPTQNQSNRRSLRRSISTDQLTASTQMRDSRTRRSSSVCRWSDYAKAHESEIKSDYFDTTDIRSVLEDSNKSDNQSKSTWPDEIQKVKHSTIKSKPKSSTHLSSLNDINSCDGEMGAAYKDGTIQLEEIMNDSVTSKEIICNEDDSNAVNASEVPDFTVQSTDNSRWQRAQSEPSSIVPPSAGSKRSRRSSSSIKINEYHKKILYRSSLRGKSFEPQKFEIIDSDTESPVAPLVTREEDIVHERSSDQKDQSGTFKDNFEDVQMEISKESIAPIMVANASTDSEVNKRMKRSHSEPPAAEIDPPKTRLRTRRSSFSQKIDKVHKLVLPRHSRSSRVSSFQPMEIVQSDDEKSFLKTPEHNKQDTETEFQQQNDETPVTTKKLRKPKTLRREDNKTSTEEVETIDPLPNIQVDSRTTQDYPQPPKKRGRSKSKREEEISQPPTENSSDVRKNVIEDKLEQIISPVQDNRDLTKPHSKTNKVKKIKNKKQNAIETETDITNEQCSPKTIERESYAADKTVKNKTSKTKKRKDTSALNFNSSDKDDLGNVLEVASQDHQTKVTKKSDPRRKKGTGDEQTTPTKTTTTKIKVATPSKEQSDSELAESSLTESQADEMSKHTKVSKEIETSFMDSPARRTRRSLSRISDTEILTPTRDRVQRRTRRSSIISDAGLSTPNKYAASEISDASTEVNVYLSTPSKPKTPGRRSTRRSESEISDASTELNVYQNTPSRKTNRRPSISATINTPELIPEELLMQRRLTRHQHSQLQKSFELSFAESPKLPRLEEVPEESEENSEVTVTPIRSSRRTKASASKGSKNKTSKK